MSTIMNTTYKIAIGADHAGVDLKETVDSIQSFSVALG